MEYVTGTPHLAPKGWDAGLRLWSLLCRDLQPPLYGPFLHPEQDNSICGAEQKQFTALVSAPCHEGALWSELLCKSLPFILLHWEGMCFLHHIVEIVSLLSCFVYCSFCYLMLSEIGEWGIYLSSFSFVLYFHSFFFRMHWLIWQNDLST